MSKITILTGAGISAESGLETFRAADGLWAQHRVEDVATPEGFERDPKLVVDFYNARRKQASEVSPNAAHKALARLQQMYAGQVVIVTQNVDDLHEQGGATGVIHMHGALKSALCAACGNRWAAPIVMAHGDACPVCTRPSARPDIVWFGEMPYQMENIHAELTRCDLFLSIGTSGNVYPAAGFVAEASTGGAHTVELNLEPSAGISSFAEAIHGKATEVVPAYVERLLSQAPPT